MTQYNTLNVKLSNSQLNKLKSAIKNGTAVTLNLSPNLIGSSNDENNFPYKLLLTSTQVSKIRKAFANGSSANIKVLKIQLSKMIESREFLVGLPPAIPQAMFLTGKEVLKRELKKGIALAKNKAPKLAEKTTEYYVNKGINELNKKFTSSKGSGITPTNNEIKDIMKVIKSLENRGTLLKETTTKITNQEGGFLNFLRPLIKVGLPLMKSVLTHPAKNVLMLLGLTATMPTTDAAIQKRFIYQELQH